MISDQYSVEKARSELHSGRQPHSNRRGLEWWPVASQELCNTEACNSDIVRFKNLKLTKEEACQRGHRAGCLPDDSGRAPTDTEVEHILKFGGREGFES